MTTAVLTADQDKALAEILAAMAPGARHLLSGHAGSGKSFLMEALARAVLKQKKTIVMTAPTHKAVAVLARKLRAAGLDQVSCRTIHSLLALKAKPDADRLVFVRDKRAEPIMEDVVVIDECSMLGEDMMRHIRRHLPRSFVLFVGDPAQLPPVGEIESQSFATKSRSHLDTIVRQAAGNPILEAATAIRVSQGGPMDWSWCKSANAPPLGVFRPGASVDAWMKKAFTSPEFEADPDSFRYLAYTNARVAEINRKVRQWRYGDNLPTPFMPGERALFRAPVIRDGDTVFSTNEEATVTGIRPDVFGYAFEAGDSVEAWVAEIPSWRMDLRRDDDEVITVHMPSDDKAVARVVDRIKDEAAGCRDRWRDLHEFNASMARLQSIYALTIHTSQGSTFSSCFLDVPDIKRRARDNVLEAQQLLYVGATRPSQALMLVGA